MPWRNCPGQVHISLKKLWGARRPPTEVATGLGQRWHRLVEDNSLSARPCSMSNPSGISQTRFGYAVAGLSGNQFAASSHEGSGKVYLFDDSQRVAAVITNPAGTSGFGNALAALGPNRLLIANPNDSDAGDN